MQDSTKPTLISQLLVGVFLVGSIIFLVFSPMPKGRVYDCSLSEISPDYPLEVKDECRKLRAKNFQEDLKKPK